MNKDQRNISLKERFELQISEPALERELKRVKMERVQAEHVLCEKEDETCMNHIIYEAVQCILCYQTPLYSLECSKCLKIICRMCVK